MKKSLIKKSILTGLVLFFALTSFPIKDGRAKEKKMHKGEWILPTHYPSGFDGYGCIQSIEPAKVIIDDAVLKLSPSVVCNTPSDTDVPFVYIAAGNLVGYIKNDQKQIISLWLIRDECNP